MVKHSVRTRDVDGSDTRYYVSLNAAIDRFESMVGYSIESAIQEHYYYLLDRGLKLPTVEYLIVTGGSVKAVSDFGCVVTIKFASVKE